MSIGGICVSRSFFVRVCMFTVSNALLMSSATAMVRAGGILWLKPDAIVLLMLWRAVVVECLALKPCCVWCCGMLLVMYGRRAFSRVFEITESSEIGRKDVPVLWSLSGFSIGMMLASFHMCGMMLVLRARLKVLVRYVRPSGPMCLRCLMLMPSTGAGPTFQWAGEVDAICRSISNRAKRPRASCILRSWPELSVGLSGYQLLLISCSIVKLDIQT